MKKLIKEFTGGYLREPLQLSTRKQIIRELCKKIRESGLEFDAIAFRGMSGALIAPTVAANLRKELILVRKGENRHSYSDVEGYSSGETYIIIDDFVSSGNTIKEIVKSISKDLTFGHYKGIAVFTYKGEENSPTNLHTVQIGLGIKVYS